MTELTTGVVFLITSLYGSAQSVNHMQNIAYVQDPGKVNIEKLVADVERITDRKAMEEYLRKEYSDTPLLVEIARCESSFRQYDEKGFLIRGRVNRNDVGVMQINEKYHIETAKKLGIDIYTLKGNVEYAKHLYEEQGSRPWSSSQPCWSKGSAIAQK